MILGIICFRCSCSHKLGSEGLYRKYEGSMGGVSLTMVEGKFQMVNINEDNMVGERAMALMQEPTTV
jgi:hypothetical protein